MGVNGQLWGPVVRVIPGFRVWGPDWVVVPLIRLRSVRGDIFLEWESEVHEFHLDLNLRFSQRTQAQTSGRQRELLTQSSGRRSALDHKTGVSQWVSSFRWRWVCSGRMYKETTMIKSAILIFKKRKPEGVGRPCEEKWERGAWKREVRSQGRSEAEVERSSPVSPAAQGPSG